MEAVSDYGNLQEVRLTTDPQAFLARLIERTPVFHFEVTRPSLHDIFVRIAQPDADAGRDRGGGPMIAVAQGLDRGGDGVPARRPQQGVPHRHRC